MASQYIRKATHQGEWYSSDSEQLTKMFQASFYYATTPKLDNLKGLISPHCCYDVCLRTAAYSYASINPDLYDRIILIGTCHHFPLQKCLVSGASEVETPFGNIVVDNEALSNLCQQSPELFDFLTQDQDEAEHSHEMQYPLIKYIFQDRDIQILPILIGSLSEENEIKIAEILSPLILADRTLFIISSDFTHWGEMFHFTTFANNRKPLSQQLVLFDEKAMNIISELNYSHFRFHISDIQGSICGCYSICLMLRILASGFSVQTLNRTELCQLSTLKDFSISFIAVAFCTSSHTEEEN